MTTEVPVSGFLVTGLVVSVPVDVVSGGVVAVSNRSQSGVSGPEVAVTPARVHEAGPPIVSTLTTRAWRPGPKRRGGDPFGDNSLSGPHAMRTGASAVRE